MKEWMLTRNVLDAYENIDYMTVDYGICYVNPENIIALCHPLEDVLTDGKMQPLEEKVNRYGWNNKKSSLDLHLLLLPDLKYVVYSGGNHRSYLSNVLGIHQVKAYTTIMLPTSKIRKIALDEIKQIEFELEKPIDDKTDSLIDQRNMILLDEAARIGIHPQFADLKIRFSARCNDAQTK